MNEEVKELRERVAQLEEKVGKRLGKRKVLQ